MIVRADDVSEQAGYEAALTLMTRRDAPDVVITTADRLAIGVVAAITELGLVVPDDVGVIGEGNTLLAQNARPALTSIDPHPDRLGRAAIELIGQILDGDGLKRDPTTVVVPASLVPRRSTRS